MKKEEKVSGIELSKNLKNFGVKQKSKRYWLWTSEFRRYELYLGDSPEIGKRALKEFPENYISAFTFPELYKLLPIRRKKNIKDDHFARTKVMNYLIRNKLTEIQSTSSARPKGDK